MAEGGQPASGGSRASVVLFGHSYIRRLGEYARRQAQEVGQDPLRMTDADVQFLGVGGATLQPRPRGRWIRNSLPELARHHPKVVILHMGENDLEYASAEEIAREILLLRDVIVEEYHCQVYVLQLVPWPKHPESTIAAVRAVNTQLEAKLPVNCYWKYCCGISSVNQSYFRHDLAHFNDTGYKQYARSIRTLVGRAVRHIT